MKDLKDIFVQESKNYGPDENGLMVLDNDEFYALILDKTTGQIQIYKNRITN